MSSQLLGTKFMAEGHSGAKLLSSWCAGVRTGETLPKKTGGLNVASMVSLHEPPDASRCFLY